MKYLVFVLLGALSVLGPVYMGSAPDCTAGESDGDRLLAKYTYFTTAELAFFKSQLSPYLNKKWDQDPAIALKAQCEAQCRWLLNEFGVSAKYDIDPIVVQFTSAGDFGPNDIQSIENIESPYGPGRKRTCVFIWSRVATVKRTPVIIVTGTMRLSDKGDGHTVRVLRVSRTCEMVDQNWTVVGTDIDELRI